jgi:hypothetical protein
MSKFQITNPSFSSDSNDHIITRDEFESMCATLGWDGTVDEGTRDGDWCLLFDDEVVGVEVE